MKFGIRIGKGLLEEIHEDLSRPHAFAHERVGFISCGLAAASDGQLLLSQRYHVVEDADYINDPRYGAMMSSAAIRKALQYAYSHPVAMLHVHRHEHRGRPKFSQVDRAESAKFIPNFWNVRPGMPHGALLLSQNALVCDVWNPSTRQPEAAEQITVVGRPLEILGRWFRR